MRHGLMIESITPIKRRHGEWISRNEFMIYNLLFPPLCCSWLRMSQLYKQTLKESMAINRPFQSKIRAAFLMQKLKIIKCVILKQNGLKILHSFA